MYSKLLCIAMLFFILLSNGCQKLSNDPGGDNTTPEVDNGLIYWGGAYNDEGMAVVQTFDGGYIIAGYAGCYDDCNLFVLKTDRYGRVEWSRSLKTTFSSSYKMLEAPSDSTFSSEQGTSIQQTDDGGFIVTGWIKANIDTLTASRLSPFIFEDVFIVKINSVGDLMMMLYDGTNNNGEETIDEGHSVLQTTDGGYIFVGTTNCWVDCDVWVLKTNANLEVEWGEAKAIDPLEDSGQRDNDIGYSIQEISDGYIITGVTNCWDDCDVLLLKIDSDGNMVWRRYYGGSGDDRGYSVQQTTDGGYIVCGNTTSFGNGNSDVYLIKTDISLYQFIIARVVDTLIGVGIGIFGEIFIYVQK